MFHKGIVVRGAYAQGLDFTAARPEGILCVDLSRYFDDREDYDELRELALGFIGVRLHVMAYVPVEDDLARIISMRKVTKKELREYEEALKRR